MQSCFVNVYLCPCCSKEYMLHLDVEWSSVCPVFVFRSNLFWFMTYLICGDNTRPVRLVVNDRKFSARTVFFSHTKSASSNNPRSYTIVSAPAEQADDVLFCILLQILHMNQITVSSSIRYWMTLFSWWNSTTGKWSCSNIISNRSRLVLALAFRR